MTDMAWYDELREKYRPARLRVLLIGESPPDRGDGARRFFYTPTLAKHDNLYRRVFKAPSEDEVLGAPSSIAISPPSKTPATSLREFGDKRCQVPRVGYASVSRLRLMRSRGSRPTRLPRSSKHRRGRRPSSR